MSEPPSVPSIGFSAVAERGMRWAGSIRKNPPSGDRMGHGGLVDSQSAASMIVIPFSETLIRTMREARTTIIAFSDPCICGGLQYVH